MKEKWRKWLESRFNKRFPDLKQVINEREVDFNMHGQIPLRYGENNIYLKATDRNGEVRRSVYTTFNVEGGKRYGLKLVYNYEYILNELKMPYLKLLLALIIGQIIIVFGFQDLSIFYWLAQFVLIGAYLYMSKWVFESIGISAYKLEVMIA